MKKKKGKRLHNCSNKLWQDESSNQKMTTNQKKKLLERKTDSVGACYYFQKYQNN